MYCELWLQYIQVRKLFKGGNYSRAETICRNTVLKKQVHKNVPLERISPHSEEIQVQVYCVGAKLNWLTRLHKHKMRFAKFLVQCPPTLLLPTKAILSCSQKWDQKLSELAFSLIFFPISRSTFIQFVYCE